MAISLVYLDHGDTSLGWGDLLNIRLWFVVHRGCVIPLDTE